MWSIPPLVEFESYKKNHPDLKHLSDAELLSYYNTIGVVLGHTPNQLRSRQDFVNIIPAAATILGPFTSPLMRHRQNIKYCDTLSTNQLKQRAQKLGLSNTLITSIPSIDYVLDGSDLSSIPDVFDAIISSHNLEHQPNLILHLQQIKTKLNPSGKYMVLIPDKRYCFDAQLPTSSVAEILDAFFRKATHHSLSSIIEHRALTTHNDAIKHWQNIDSSIEIDTSVVNKAIEEYLESINLNTYIDVHAWQFTPETFQEIINTLNKLNLIDLKIEMLYPTRRHQNEFWAILS